MTNRQMTNRKLQDVPRHGADALKLWNPKDDRTHPAVRRIIEERGEKAGFFIKEGILFQLTAGLAETKGIAAYYPVSGCYLHETSRLAKIFECEEKDIPNIIFWKREIEC